MKINVKNEQGITLVALIITIIVLVILAAVTISATFNSGIINTAVNGTINYVTAQKQEKVTFDDLDKDIQDIVKRLEEYDIGGNNPETKPTEDPTVVRNEIPTEYGVIQQANKKVSDGIAEIWIPKGFAVVDPYKQSTTSADVIYTDKEDPKISEGIVITDKVDSNGASIGNEWVWIPCYVEDGVGTDVASAVEYKRTDFGQYDNSNSNSTYSYYSETLDSTDKESIKTYGGYYIGRYEAGADRQVSGEDTTRKVLIQSNKYPYNYVKQSYTVTKSAAFAGDNGYDTNKVYTKITSSYAWDTAISFMQNTVEDYGTNSPQGNYSDTQFISGSKLLNTGLTTAVCNIYDMGGNVHELTSERSSYNGYQCARRGGTFDLASGRCAAGRRHSCHDWNVYASDTGFRLTLYLK